MIEDVIFRRTVISTRVFLNLVFNSIFSKYSYLTAGLLSSSDDCGGNTFSFNLGQFLGTEYSFFLLLVVENDNLCKRGIVNGIIPLHSPHDKRTEPGLKLIEDSLRKQFCNVCCILTKPETYT